VSAPTPCSAKDETQGWEQSFFVDVDVMKMMKDVFRGLGMNSVP
jgi:hypothetical protein